MLTISIVIVVVFLKNIKDTERKLRIIDYDAIYKNISSGLDLPSEELVKKIKGDQIVNYICYYWSLMLVVLSIIGLAMECYKKGIF